MLQNQHHLWMTSRCGVARHWRGPLLALVSLSWLFLAGSVLVVGEDDEDDFAPPVAGERQIMITEQQFDQMVFGGRQTIQQRVVVQKANGEQGVAFVPQDVAQTSVADFRKRMETNANVEIETVARQVLLTEAQKKKLKLAVRGDIEQFISRVAELRPKLTSKPMTPQEYAEFIRELQPLRMTQQFGVIGENSLFRKTLRNTLNDEQRVRWQALERERQRTVIESAILTWERMANGVKIPVASRQKFVEVLVEYGNLPETRHTYITYVVLVEAGKLEDRLKPIVSEEIWEKLQVQIAQAKQVEVSLRKSGQWPARPADDEDGLADTTKE
ncbi:MAG: hypothetical protein ACKV2Q_26365 [Planctomycetaceae bacterium]